MTNDCIREPYSISSFCDRIVSFVGSVKAVGSQSYTVGSGDVVSCDVLGSAGSVSLTMFPNGKTIIPDEADFHKGRLGGDNNEIELELTVRDIGVANSICELLSSALRDVGAEACVP